MSKPGGGASPGPEPDALHITSAQLEMGAALLYGLHRKDERVGFVGHCARVGLLIAEMADLLGLPVDERHDLLAAAQLHEIGMLAVPTRLLEDPGKLDQLSVARIRQQATIGAEVVGITHPPRVSLLVECQYMDFAAIRARYSAESRETLLAGLLRVADVLDAMVHPRPYQDPLEPVLAMSVLRRGTGTKFHPLAVQSLLQAEISA